MTTVAVQDLAMKLAEGIDSERLWQESFMQLRDHGIIDKEKLKMGDLRFIVTDVIDDFKLAHKKSIQEHLFNLVWPALRRQLTYGIGTWYKNKIAPPEVAEEIKLIDLGEAGA